MAASWGAEETFELSRLRIPLRELYRKLDLPQMYDKSDNDP